jgi:hypothetical protein
MPDLIDNPIWEPGIYELATVDPVLGGPGGVSTRPAQELANRTAYLKAQLESHAATAAPHSGHETPSGAQTKVNTHAALTSAHSADSAATPSRLMIRDGSGRAKVAAPSESTDIAIKQTVDDHASLTNPHSATSVATANRLVLRDGNGRAKFAAGVASGDAVTFEQLTGAVIGRAATVWGTHNTLTSVIPLDDTIPQSSEGSLLATVAYTPKYIGSKLTVRALVNVSSNLGGPSAIAALCFGVATSACSVGA